MNAVKSVDVAGCFKDQVPGGDMPARGRGLMTPGELLRAARRDGAAAAPGPAGAAAPARRGLPVEDVGSDEEGEQSEEEEEESEEDRLKLRRAAAKWFIDDMAGVVDDYDEEDEEEDEDVCYKDAYDEDDDDDEPEEETGGEVDEDEADAVLASGRSRAWKKRAAKTATRTTTPFHPLKRRAAALDQSVEALRAAVAAEAEVVMKQEQALQVKPGHCTECGQGGRAEGHRAAEL